MHSGGATELTRAVQTLRLALVPLTHEIVRTRLATPAFTLRIALRDGEAPRPVHFPAAWPGDGEVLLPGALRELDAGRSSGHLAAVRLADGLAIGMLGPKGEPRDGEVEIGYGFIRESWGAGFATEAVRALTALLHTQLDVHVVTAQTIPTNRASARVLEKAGFQPAGTRNDDHDGTLVLWRNTRA